MFQRFRQFPNRFEQKIRPCRSQSLLCWKRSQHRYSTNSRSLRHLQILRRISHVHASRWLQTKLLQSQPQRSGVRFLFRSIPAAHARCKHPGEPELAQLLHHTIPVAAGNQTQVMRPPEPREHLPRPHNESRRVLRILRAPRPVRIVPPRLRQFRGSVHAVPIRRIMPRQFLQPPRNPHLAKHRQIRRRISAVRINQRAVPIKQHSLQIFIFRGGHQSLE
jgi:hypothetical protein